MLYISRRLDDDEFGVVDTDDGEETIVNLDDLVEAFKCGLEIVGAYCETDCWGEPIQPEDPEWYAYVEFVHQPEETISVQQSKLKVLHGVDLKIFKEAIVAITWDETITKPDLKLCLSQFATKLGDYAFYHSDSDLPLVPITIILDDKIELEEHSLEYFFETGARLDIRDLTYPPSVNLVYEKVAANREFDSLGKLIDSKRRIKHYEKIFGGFDAVY